MLIISDSPSKIKIPDELINWGNGWGRPYQRTKTIVQKLYEYLIGVPENPWKIEGIFDQDEMCFLAMKHSILDQYTIVVDAYDQRYEAIQNGFSLKRGKMISEKCRVWIHSEDYHDTIHLTSPADGDYAKWIIGWLGSKDFIGTSKIRKNLKDIGDFIFGYIQNISPSWEIIEKKLHETPKSDYDKRLQLVYEAIIKNNENGQFKVNIILREHWFDEYGKKRAEKCDISIDLVTEDWDTSTGASFDCVNHLHAVNWAINWLENFN